MQLLHLSGSLYSHSEHGKLHLNEKLRPFEILSIWYVPPLLKEMNDQESVVPAFSTLIRMLLIVRAN